MWCHVDWVFVVYRKFLCYVGEYVHCPHVIHPHTPFYVWFHTPFCVRTPFYVHTLFCVHTPFTPLCILLIFSVHSENAFQFITRIWYKAPSCDVWGEHEIDYILFIQAGMHNNIPIQMWTHFIKNTYTHPHIHTQIHTSTSTHRYIHIHTQIHTSTYPHIHFHAYSYRRGGASQSQWSVRL